ncbi:MAG: hypothetical protein AAF658_10700, partial [Myxococcota bacterium]
AFFNAPALGGVGAWGGTGSFTGALLFGFTAANEWIVDAQAGDVPPARLAHQMIYDERRERLYLIGGNGDEPGTGATEFCGDSRLCEGLYSFDGTTWREENPLDPLNAGAPRPNEGQPAFVRIPSLDVSLVHGGRITGSGDEIDETWLLHAGASESLSHIAAFDLSAHGFSEEDTVQDVVVRWRASASGGDGTGGARLYLWDWEVWRPLAIESSDDTLQVLEGRLAGTPAVATLLGGSVFQRALIGRRRTLRLALATRGVAESGTSVLSTDDVEVTVIYRRPAD